MKPNLKPYHNKLKALFAQHTHTVPESSQPKDEPTIEPAAPVSPYPVDSGGPAPHYSDKKAFAEYVARQNGYVPGFEVTASVSPKKIENNHFVYILVPNWSELRCGSRRLGWNLADYMQELQVGIHEALRTSHSENRGEA